MGKFKIDEFPDFTHHRIDRREVFIDLLTLFAIRISNRVDPVHYRKRDELGKSINDKYTPAEHAEMYKYLTALVSQIKDNHKAGIIEDLLGGVMEISRFSRDGQDQTPPDLARLSAHITLKNEPVVPEKGYFELDEHACGSGSMVLAFAEDMLTNDLNYCEQLVVRATDLDLRCVHMAYIQLSLYGIPAVVIHGNTITLQEYSRWYTPMYILRNWVWRSPCCLTGGKSPVDEMLKRMTNPQYDAMRRAQELLET